MAKDDAADVMETCRRNARTMLASNPDAALESIEELAACVETGVARKLEIANEEISFQARIRTGMAGLLENYTCVDGNLTSTPDVSSADWNFKGINRRVHVKHDRPASQIHVIEDFISPEECLAMEQEAARTLHHATVADGKGGSRLSDNRKAMQAGITVEWETEAEGNLIAQLSRRVYDYTENVLKLGIQEHGQEDLMSIQYFGRGRNDTEPDRYTPVSVVLCCAVLCCAVARQMHCNSLELLFSPFSLFLLHSIVTATAPAFLTRQVLAWPPCSCTAACPPRAVPPTFAIPRSTSNQLPAMPSFFRT
jgi:hypothetical protein